MQTTDVPPVFRSGQYATYGQNNMSCIGSDLLLLLLSFPLCSIVEIPWIKRCLLFFCNSNILYFSEVPSRDFASVFWTILSKKHKQFYRGILWKRCPGNSYISFEK